LSMRLRLLLGFAVLLIFIGLVACLEGDSQIETYSVTVDQPLIREEVNLPLLDVSRIFWSKEIRIKPIDPVPFSVYQSNNKQELSDFLHSRGSLDTFPSVSPVPCKLFTISTSEECSFSLTYYGEPTKGLPRIENIFHDPPKTFLGVQLDSKHGQRVLFNVETVSVDKTKILATLAGLAVFLFTFSKFLSHSPQVYMFCWVLAGAFLGLVSIAVFLMYTGSKLIGKNLQAPTLLLLTTLGWSTMFAANLSPSFEDVLRNGYWLSFVVVGALIGLWFGYTTETTATQRGRVSIVIRVTAIGLIYWSINHYELSLLLIVLIFLDVPTRIIGYLQNILLHFSPSYRNAKRKETLRRYQETPSLLAKLKPAQRKAILQEIGDPHLMIAYDVYEEVVNK